MPSGTTRTTIPSQSHCCAKCPPSGRLRSRSSHIVNTSAPALPGCPCPNRGAAFDSRRGRWDIHRPRLPSQWTKLPKGQQLSHRLFKNGKNSPSSARQRRSGANRSPSFPRNLPVAARTRIRARRRASELPEKSSPSLRRSRPPRTRNRARRRSRAHGRCPTVPGRVGLARGCGGLHAHRIRAPPRLPNLVLDLLRERRRVVAAPSHLQTVLLLVPKKKGLLGRVRARSSIVVRRRLLPSPDAVLSSSNDLCSVCVCVCSW